MATPDEYDIITPDGKKHKLDYKLVQKFPNQVDLALVPFTSPQAYKVVDMGIPNQPRVGNPAFVSGFPQIHETFLRLAPQVNSALKFPTPASRNSANCI